MIDVLRHSPSARRRTALAVFGALLASGCLSLDYTPFEDQRFHRKASEIREGLKTPPSSTGPLSAGSARIEITPPIGFPLAGFGGRKSTGIHDPVYARALVVSTGAAPLAIVSIDALAMTDDLSEAVVLRVRKEIEIPSDNILVTATHTHSGPGALGRRFWEQLAAGPFDRRYFDWTAEQTARAVVTAYRRMQPSRVSVFRIDAADRVVNRVIPDGPIDPEIQVLLFESKNGSSRTYLVNFAAHPTVLRSRNRLVSGDFPGFLSTGLETDESTVAVYTSGALGDLKARTPEGRGVFDRAEKMGTVLTEKIRRAIPLVPARDRVTLSSVKIRIPLPPPQPKVSTVRRLPSWIGRLFFDGSTIVQVLQIDRTFLIGVPGDLGSEVGVKWKKEAREHGNDAVILGFSNDYVGYIMPSYYFDKPTHESAMSFNGPYMADYLGSWIEGVIAQEVTEK